MTDVFPKRKRAEIMSANRGSNNRSTERNLRVRLAAARIRGWRINARDVFGHPDFVFDDYKIAIFVDGCFWHGCNKCRNIPTSNRSFWSHKISSNKLRDRKVTRKLRRTGWQVLRFWEHQLRIDPQKCISTIQAGLLQHKAANG